MKQNNWLEDNGLHVWRGISACIKLYMISYKIKFGLFIFQGLVVPVVRNVESMNYAEIELAIAALGEKARKGTLAVEDMDGGTFTISNGGVFGSLMGTPIINPPQSAILGMHAIFDRPVAVKGQVIVSLSLLLLILLLL